MTVQDGFGHLLDNLKLDPDEVKRARAVHNELSDLLIAKGVAVRTRLQGSFARKTMLRPLKDVDKIIELRTEHEGLLREPGGTEAAFAMIRDAVQSKFPMAWFEPKRHALCIHLPDCPFDFDAVPAFNTPATDTGMIEIANTDDDTWDESNTYILIAAVQKRNDDCSGAFIHQVRMAKQAFKTHGVKIPGLHIETFAYRAVTTKTDHPAAVLAILDKAVAMLAGDYMDLTDFDRISDKVDESERITARATLTRVAADARRAVDLAAEGDEHGACTIWRNVFGDNFPMPGPAPAKQGISNLFKGGSVLGGVTTAVRPSNPANPTRSWRP